MIKRELFFSSLILLIFITYIGCPGTGDTGDSPKDSAVTVTKNLNVALYPFVPRLSQFKEVIVTAWQKEQPGITLNFINWDCYSEDPKDELDVFVFDGIFLTYFAEKGFLSTLDINEIENPGDIIDYALEGCNVNDKYYGIPQFSCTNVLYYRKDNDRFNNVETLDQLYRVMGKNDSSQIPPSYNKGLLINLSGGTTCSCLYLETILDMTGKYTPDPVLPSPTQLDNGAMDNLRKLVYMAGKGQSQYEPDPYEAYTRAAWFAKNSGKAFVGFTESLWKMKDYSQNVEFKLMPMGNKNINVFYIDIVGIHSKIDNKDKRKSAVKLANLITSTKVMETCLGPTNNDKYPQYLMPTRHSIYTNLKSDYPVYGKIYDLVKEKEAYAFRIGKDSKPWLKSIKKIIHEKILEITENL